MADNYWGYTLKETNSVCQRRACLPVLTAAPNRPVEPDPRWVSESEVHGGSLCGQKRKGSCHLSQGFPGGRCTERNDLDTEV